MKCENCDTVLRATRQFCPTCGLFNPRFGIDEYSTATAKKDTKRAKTRRIVRTDDTNGPNREHPETRE